MSFWNFIGQLALFNTVRNWFFHRNRNESYPYQQGSGAGRVEYWNDDFERGFQQDPRVRELNARMADMKKKLEENRQLLDERGEYGVEDYDIDELQDQIDDFSDNNYDDYNDYDDYDDYGQSDCDDPDGW